MGLWKPGQASEQRERFLGLVAAVGKARTSRNTYSAETYALTGPCATPSDDATGPQLRDDLRAPSLLVKVFPEWSKVVRS
jgi:hypothetical protein